MKRSRKTWAAMQHAVLLPTVLIALASCARSPMPHPTTEAAWRGKPIDGRFELCTRIDASTCQNVRERFSRHQDKQVALLLKFVAVSADTADKANKVSIKWYAGDRLVHESDPVSLVPQDAQSTFPAYYRWSVVSQVLGLQQLPDSFLGPWTVAVFVDGQLTGNKKFEVSQ